MIQIIAGTFGYNNGRKVIPITSADGPIELDPALEARLVAKKVAVYVTPDAEETKAETDELPAYNPDMKLADLQAAAAAYGVDASAMRKKADVIAAIEAVQDKAAEEPDEEHDEDPDEDLDEDLDEEPEEDPDADIDAEGDDEPPPALGATDPV